MKKNNKTNTKGKPMILAVCTPLMYRVHETIQQAGEMTFCDATYNNTLVVQYTQRLFLILPLCFSLCNAVQYNSLQ